MMTVSLHLPHLQHLWQLYYLLINYFEINKSNVFDDVKLSLDFVFLPHYVVRGTIHHARLIDLIEREDVFTKKTCSSNKNWTLCLIIAILWIDLISSNILNCVAVGFVWNSI